MLKTIAAATIAIVAFAGSAQASQGDPVTGWQLVAQCRTNGPGLLACLNYLRGVWDGLAASSYGTKVTLACAGSGGITAGEMREVFLNYADNHPAELHFESGAVASVAFVKTLPCGRQS